MDKSLSKNRPLLFTEKSAPIAFLTATVLGFGLLIPSLGYYMDDWAYVFYANLKGVESLREMLMYDTRPYAAWLYMLGFKTLGFKPIAWHLMSLLMHWGIVVTFWALFRSIWPSRKVEALQASLLFAVFPFFLIQPSPIAYTHVWFGFWTFNLSLIFMVWAFNSEPRKAIPMTILAMALEAAHLFTGEYFAGLELVRPVILWIVLSRTEPIISKRASSILLLWLPYLAVMGLFAYWRIILYLPPPDITRNSPVILQQLFSEPFKAIGFLVDRSLRDALSVLTTGWQKATDAELLDFESPFALFRQAVALASFLLAFFYLTRFQADNSDSNEDWTRESLSLAILSLLTGGLPVWLTGRAIVESKNLLSASRFGIPAILGAALITFLLINWLITEKRKKIVILSLILAVSINFHLANTKQFQYSWEKQIRLAKELLWRAPSIQPGTAILTDEEVLGVMGEYAVSFSLNNLYQAKGIENAPPYWYFPFYYTNPDIDSLLRGDPLEYSKLSMTFTGNSKQMLLLSFNPELRRCLWVMQPQDTNLRLVSDDMRKLSAGSDIRLIGQGETRLPEVLYGKQNTQTWCYYFEKADLARQYGQWDEIARLWEESQAIGERADNGFEYIPFIEGFAHLGDWEQVISLTRSANRITSGLEPSLCSALERIMKSTPPDGQRDHTLSDLNSQLSCENY
jgi:hypothetical protein